MPVKRLKSIISLVVLSSGCLFVLSCAGNAPQRSPDSLVFPAEIKINNPYINYPGWYKGQLHTHSTRSDGRMTPAEVLLFYREKGFDFISLTDHDKRGVAKDQCQGFWFCGREELPCEEIHDNPQIPGILYLPGRESGKGYRTHLVEIGIREKACRPKGKFRLKQRIEWISRENDGFSFAAHPLHQKRRWPERTLYQADLLLGLEINEPAEQQLWDQLLAANRRLFGFATDDLHKRSDVNRGFVVVNSPEKDAGQLMENLRRGNFYSVVPASPEVGDRYPSFVKIESANDSYPYMLRVVVAKTLEIRFVSRNQEVASRKFSQEGDHAIDFPINGTEGYVRIEIEDSAGTVSYSQPLFIEGEKNLPANR